MPATPVMPASGTLVIVSGTRKGESVSFESIDDFRAKRPTFPVQRVQIYSTRLVIRPQLLPIDRFDGTRIESSDDGVVAICTPDGAQFPVEAALGAYGWLSRLSQRS